MATVSRILLAAAAAAGLAAPASAQVAVRAETLHTSAGAPITDGVVLISASGKIERVGPASQVQIPGSYKTLRAKVATPGLIDAHSVVGLAGALNYPHDQMQLESSAPIQPELRAVDAYNARETLVEWLRTHGVTTIHTGHGPGARHRDVRGACSLNGPRTESSASRSSPTCSRYSRAAR